MPSTDETRLPNDHTVAHAPPDQSLRVRLATLVTVVSLVVVGGGALVQTTLYEWRAEQAIREAGEQAAREIADTLAVAPMIPTAAAVHTLLEASGTGGIVDRTGVLLRTGDQTWLGVSSSDSLTAAESATAREAIEATAKIWSEEREHLRTVAIPISRDGQWIGAAVSTVSFQLEHEVASRSRMLVLWFAAGTAIVLVVLVSHVERKLIHQPLSAILQTVQRYSAGDFSARTSVSASDEIGLVASSLNAMLARIEQLHASLQERVDEATTELRLSNSDLVTSYQRMFALREALARAEQTAAAGQTAANLAHQLGTPLNLISGYVQMMVEEAEGDQRRLDRLRSMEEQIKRVTGYVRTTLDAVRRPALPREPLFPADVLRRLTETTRPRLTAGHITVDMQVADNLPWMLGDPVHLELALLNIVNNALDAMPGGGTLTIVGEARGQETHIEIRDTGTGIPPDLLPRIFEPWITTKPVGQGTGLGLSIARDVIAAHGGRIDVRSSPGAGTTFIIDLPGKTGSPAPREV